MLIANGVLFHHLPPGDSGRPVPPIWDKIVRMNAILHSDTYPNKDRWLGHPCILRRVFGPLQLCAHLWMCALDCPQPCLGACFEESLLFQNSFNWLCRSPTPLLAGFLEVGPLLRCTILMSGASVQYSNLLASGCLCVASTCFPISHNSSAIMEDAASQQANKALHFAFSSRLADIVSNHDMKRLIKEFFSVPLPVTLDGLKVLNSLQGWSCTCMDPPPSAGNGFEITEGLVGWMGGLTRYSLR